MLANCLTEEGARELRQGCSERLETLLFDVTDLAGIERAYAQVCERVGEDGVFFCAVFVCTYVGVYVHGKE